MSIRVLSFRPDPSMTSGPLRYVEITDPSDPLLLPWLDLYETAFPPDERILVSGHLRVLQACAAAIATAEHLLALLDDTGDLVGMARATIRPAEIAYLWYMAISASQRGRGLGSAFYREIVRRAEEADCPALMLEVEIPERAAGQAQRQAAERRIGFYRRLGAKLLGGVHYLQSVGTHQQPVPMHIMAQTLKPLGPKDVFALAQLLFNGAVQTVGRLTLD